MDWPASSRTSFSCIVSSYLTSSNSSFVVLRWWNDKIRLFLDLPGPGGRPVGGRSVGLAPGRPFGVVLAVLGQPLVAVLTLTARTDSSD